MTEKPAAPIKAAPIEAAPVEPDRIDEAMSRVVDLEAELEAAGTTTREATELARARRLLHEWVDTICAVVATPGVGRVVLFHADGSESRIASPDLPFRLAVPVSFGSSEG